MTFSLVEAQLDVRTPVGSAGYSTVFRRGLNVLSADNTWGKSTLMQSIIFCLGLEGMFSASRRVPLGEAMTRVIDTRTGRGQVVESRATLTIESSSGEYLRMTRFPVSLDADTRLVQTWRANSLDELDRAARIDTYVNMEGAAQRERGFHSQLADFLGWQLPLVPNFSGGESPLYLELLFPLFYIEQKYGWSGVAPRVPTHLRIREPIRRGVEYVLGLGTLSRIKQREALRAEIAAIRSEWREIVHAVVDSARSRGWEIFQVDFEAVGTSQRRNALVAIPMAAGSVRPLPSQLERWRKRYMELSSTDLPLGGQRTNEARAELREAEQQLSRYGAELRHSVERLEMAASDEQAIVERIQEIDSDRKRLLDIQRLERLGSTLEIAVLTDGQCPTCHQDLDGRHVGTGLVQGIAETIVAMDGEKKSLVDLLESVRQRMRLAESLRVAASTNVQEAQQRIRLLRDELVSSSDSPSYAAVHEKLQLSERVAAAEALINRAASMDESLDQLAERYDDIRNRLALLDSSDDGEADLRLVNRWRDSFKAQLSLYGLASLPPAEVTIDERTLIPAHDGLELAFDVTQGMSASDTVRTKWAYYGSLMETALHSSSGRHAGLLILDEPRQQEARSADLSQFLRRVSSVSPEAQVIYATSQRGDELDQILQGIKHWRLESRGSHLLG
jgi:hypothetical protein